MAIRTLDGLAVAGRHVLLRADLNVPMHEGAITDRTRLERVTPTIRELAGKGARVIVCSHFGRPGGRRVPELSLAPVARALAEVLGCKVRFAEDCIGTAAHQAIDALGEGAVAVLENTRFHPGEETNDPGFARELAAPAEIYVNDAFSASHRAHASTEGVAHFLPAYAGRLMQRELAALDAALGHKARPAAAVVGGAKVSTKLELLGNLIGRVDVLAIGGAMANTFVAAAGIPIGRSLQEPDLHEAARAITERAKAQGCELLLPVDAVTAVEPKENAPSETVLIHGVAEDSMILDIGPVTVELLKSRLPELKTLVWNGPLGAFETPPFDAGTVAFARAVATATQGGLCSVAGGGDTVAALHRAGVLDRFSYVSTAGGAFLEWLEGKTLPGVAALEG